MMRKGFISGIALTLIVVAAVLVFGKVSNAQGAGSPIWQGLWQGVNIATGNASGTIKTPSGPTSNTNNSTRYVALGDSVAAGLGLPLVANATEQDQRCGHSSESYAYQVGRKLDLTTNVYACSAASSGDLYTRQWISNYNPRVQIDQAFANGTPKLLSITVGANDMRWSSLVRQCYVGSCGSTYQTKSLQKRLDNMRGNLEYALRQIQSRAASDQQQPPQVILTGYYNPVSADCTLTYPDRVTAEEVSWVGDGVTRLNQSLRSIAESHSNFVTFASLDFDGHDICSTDPWIQGLSDAAPIHPTTAGQQAIADAVLQAYKR